MQSGRDSLRNLNWGKGCSTCWCSAVAGGCRPDSELGSAGPLRSPEAQCSGSGTSGCFHILDGPYNVVQTCGSIDHSLWVVGPIDEMGVVELCQLVGLDIVCPARSLCKGICYVMGKRTVQRRQKGVACDVHVWVTGNQVQAGYHRHSHVAVAPPGISC